MYVHIIRTSSHACREGTWSSASAISGMSVVSLPSSEISFVGIKATEGGKVPLVARAFTNRKEGMSERDAEGAKTLIACTYQDATCRGHGLRN